MIRREGFRTVLDQYAPKREFELLIDPDILPIIADKHSAILQLVVDLRHLSPSLNVRFLTTSKNNTSEPIFEIATIMEDAETLSLKDLKADDPRSAILGEDESARVARSLCEVGYALKVDGIVTNNSLLREAQHLLYRDNRIRILHEEELEDFIETCAHGHGVFWSASLPSLLFSDIYYPRTNHQCKKLARWGDANVGIFTNPNVKKHIWHIMLNRYPFIHYARDMVRFYQIQKDHYVRRNLDRLNFELTYHVNMYYLLLWGMLDHLALLANIQLPLGLSKRKCGIRNKKFLAALEDKVPELKKFLSSAEVTQWITMMSEFRHNGAHQMIPIPTVVLAETEDSTKSPEELFEMAIAEDSGVETLLSVMQGNPSFLETLKPLIVEMYRIRKMKRVADHMVMIEGSTGAYYWSPIINIDHDLENLTAVVNKFIKEIFPNSVGAEDLTADFVTPKKVQ